MGRGNLQTPGAPNADSCPWCLPLILDERVSRTTLASRPFLGPSFTEVSRSEITCRGREPPRRRLSHNRSQNAACVHIPRDSGQRRAAVGEACPVVTHIGISAVERDKTASSEVKLLLKSSAHGENQGRARCGLAATIVASGFPFSTDLVTLDTSYYCSDRQNLSRWSEKNSMKPPIAQGESRLLRPRGRIVVASSGETGSAETPCRPATTPRRARRCSVVSHSHRPTSGPGTSSSIVTGRGFSSGVAPRGLQEADALDVSQAVLSKLAVELRQFRYDPARSFRRWLRTLVRHAAHDAMMARRRNLGGGALASDEMLEGLEAREDLVRRLERGV